jgi:hypothetical protein
LWQKCVRRNAAAWKGRDKSRPYKIISTEAVDADWRIGM